MLTYYRAPQTLWKSTIMTRFLLTVGPYERCCLLQCGCFDQWCPDQVGSRGICRMTRWQKARKDEEKVKMPEKFKRETSSITEKRFSALWRISSLRLTVCLLSSHVFCTSASRRRQPKLTGSKTRRPAPTGQNDPTRQDAALWHNDSLSGKDLSVIFNSISYDS